jgi:hypothetical protein
MRLDSDDHCMAQSRWPRLPDQSELACFDTPCFTIREEKVLAGVQAPAGRPRNRKERLDHAEPVPASSRR